MKSPIGEVEHECVFMLRMTETGDKIEKVDQWMDSAKTLEFFKELSEYHEKNAGA